MSTPGQNQAMQYADRRWFDDDSDYDVSPPPDDIDQQTSPPRAREATLAVDEQEESNVETSSDEDMNDAEEDFDVAMSEAEEDLSNEDIDEDDYVDINEEDEDEDYEAPVEQDHESDKDYSPGSKRSKKSTKAHLTVDNSSSEWSHRRNPARLRNPPQSSSTATPLQSPTTPMPDPRLGFQGGEVKLWYKALADAVGLMPSKEHKKLWRAEARHDLLLLQRMKRRPYSDARVAKALQQMQGNEKFFEAATASMIRDNRVPYPSDNAYDEEDIPAGHDGDWRRALIHWWFPRLA